MSAAAAWAGPFESDYMGTYRERAVKGIISVTLPDVIADMPEAMATFHYTGPYRQGQISDFRFRYVAPSQTGSGVQRPNTGVVAEVAAFKGTCAKTAQTISFSVTLLTHDVMKGTYRSESPEDGGAFTLRRLT